MVRDDESCSQTASADPQVLAVAFTQVCKVPECFEFSEVLTVKEIDSGISDGSLIIEYQLTQEWVKRLGEQPLFFLSTAHCMKPLFIVGLQTMTCFSYGLALCLNSAVTLSLGHLLLYAH